MYFEKKSEIDSEVPFEIPHMIDSESDKFLYYNDYLILSDSVYEGANMVNLSQNLISDESNRIHAKLCLSLAQT